nr:ethanolamine utilization protein EutH [Tissierella sp.]
MIYIIVLFAVLGGIDYIFKNRFGLGIKFEEGFLSMGGMGLSIIGIYTLSPVIARLITPVLYPLSDLFRTDPSVFIGSILAVDLGGYLTSTEIARSTIVGEFNGIILASMMGSTISFTIPVALKLIDDADFRYFSKGILAGIVTVPLGMIVSGLMMKVPALDLIQSLFPVIVFSILIVIAMVKFFDKVLKGFMVLGKAILIISTLGLLLSILDFMFGVQLVSGMLPFEEAVIVVGKIAIILAGAYPLIYFTSVKLQKTFKKISLRYDLDEYSILGLISSTVNNVPMMGIYKEMNWKGKIMNAAFSVSGAFVFGGQFGYVSTVAPASANAFIAGKLVGGISALVLAVILINREAKQVNNL